MIGTFLLNGRNSQLVMAIAFDAKSITGKVTAKKYILLNSGGHKSGGTADVTSESLYVFERSTFIIIVFFNDQKIPFLTVISVKFTKHHFFKIRCPNGGSGRPSRTTIKRS